MAGFGSGGGKLNLSPSPQPYVAQVADVGSAEGRDFNNQNAKVPQFKWTIHVWVNGAWQVKTLFTGINFTDLANVRDPQYVSKLTRLVRACGLPVPQSVAEAQAWDERSLIGNRLGIKIEPDPETGVLQERFVRLQPAAPAQPSQPSQPHPSVPAPAAYTPSPASQPTQSDHPAPPAPSQPAPAPAGPPPASYAPQPNGHAAPAPHSAPQGNGYPAPTAAPPPPDAPAYPDPFVAPPAPAVVGAGQGSAEDDLWQ